jgi:N-acetylglucosaminyldiphosphoundecaprenol N-acetyl-beta-D-mannosaminyltransferase
MTAPPQQGAVGERPARAVVLGCAIDRVELDQAVDLCERYVDTRTPAQNVAINAAKLVSLQSDPKLQAIVNRCELVTADGVPIVWASRLLGDPLPGRVNGTDLMYRLFARAEERGYRVYILGARAEVLEEAVRKIRGDYPALRIVGYRDGYFDPGDDERVAREIRAAAPDILFVAISSPRKEYFLGRQRARMNVPLVLGVGGSIDVVAGVVTRAPVFMQRAGLEWLWRLLQEPRRMFRRYATTNTRFIALVAQALVRRVTPTRSRTAAR